MAKKKKKGMAVGGMSMKKKGMANGGMGKKFPRPKGMARGGFFGTPLRPLKSKGKAKGGARGGKK